MTCIQSLRFISPVDSAVCKEPGKKMGWIIIFYRLTRQVYSSLSITFHNLPFQYQGKNRVWKIYCRLPICRQVTKTRYTILIQIFHKLWSEFHKSTTPVNTLTSYIVLHKRERLGIDLNIVRSHSYFEPLLYILEFLLYSLEWINFFTDHI